ncbi:MAG: ribosome small subunit-dependent GTPase A [Verrucomicrobia bacterium]|nr:ribosome small subunit-dependent GTPase A [Verrucomicrobiota bacterium]
MSKNDHFEHEDAFQAEEKRDSRRDRKILSRKDRSKFKKTDIGKHKKEPPKGENLREGHVLAIMADGILVDCDDILYTCNLRGALKKENLKIKNLIAVGDIVLFEPQSNLQGSIVYVKERYSILSRAEQISRRKEQLIAVNIDQVIITASVITPPLKTSLIDRYIIAALKGNMTPMIVINKIDLLMEDTAEKALFEQAVAVYHNLGIPIFPVSTKTCQGIDALRAAMLGKSSVFSGQSGTGKSSLINAITGSSLLTGEVVAKTGKGSHTTTSTHLLPIEGGGFCVDTPGIKSFGMWDLKEDEVRQFFVEIDAVGRGCKFPNCSHMHEPSCAVQKAVEEGEISPLRFDSYCALIMSLRENIKR